MLWSLLKVLVFFLVLAGLALGAAHVIEEWDGLQLVFGTTEVTLGPLQMVVGAVLIFAGIWLLLKVVGFAVALIRFLNGDETAMSRYLDRSREQRGYEALSDGILALTAGEGRLAINKALRAEKFLKRPELTNLIIAQASEQVGDGKRATEAWKRLLDDDRTRFVAIRGLMRQKLAEGDTQTALRLAEKALTLRPKHTETQDILLKLQAESGDWIGARRTLEVKAKAGALPKDVYKRRDAVLALQEAREVLAEGNTVEAREAAIAANRQSPDLIPAAALAARTYIASADTKSAARLLRKAWEMQPHPDLAAAFAEIAPDETPAERLKRFEALTTLNPRHEETRLLLAELNIGAEDFPAARRAIGTLAETHPTARTLAIMAAVERGEGADDAVVRGWLAKALTASRGPTWVCANCNAVHAAWMPICGNCAGFDTLQWKEAPDTAGPSATQAELLPVLVNPPAHAEVSHVAEEDVEPENPAPALDLDALRKAEN